ncbi:adhesion G-protein coupled receptor G2-like [Megalops cyprinoides]|uniref:adhesion G-protein coupled receptor G2-like n=1 Tax=Megalops cyprinoides TaxID=118141 RepID=UPI0018645F96|nr:adhesion G-protein coupled receptor G2-like [Megalops cyprinoides]
MEPVSHPSITRPVSHTSTTRPVSHASTTGAVSHPSTTRPVSHPSTTRPVSHTSITRPVSHTSTTRPVSHASTTGAVSHPSTTGAVSHPSTTRPVSHPSTTRPASHTSTTGPVSHASTTGPASHASIPGPGSHASTAKTGSHTSICSCEFITQELAGNVESINTNTASGEDDVELQIPLSAFSAALGDSGEVVSIAALWFKDDSLFPVNREDTLLNGRVVAIDLGKDISGLTDCINITFYHQNASLVSKTNASCVFWDVAENGEAHWSRLGCHSETQAGKVLCSCNHLSFFAVLLVRKAPVDISSPSLPPLSPSSVWLLTLLSRIGSGVSVVFLTLVLFIHAVSRRSKSEHSLSIHLHLCVALLCLNLTFLINDSLTALGIGEVCILIAAVMHFSLLATLTWFAIEGFHLYLLVVRVFNIHFRRYLLKLALAGWGELQEIVCCALQKQCWLNDSVLFHLTFGFFALVFLVNLVIFVTVVVRVVRARQLSPALLEKGVTKRDVFSLIGLSWLLGVSWGVLLFGFGQLTEAVFFIFCTINSLHGFFLFLRYCSLTRKKGSADRRKTTTTTTSYQS